MPTSPPSTETTDTTWIAVCSVDEVLDRTGVCALVGDRQIAIFRHAEDCYALDNRDPCSGAQVLSRGIVGDVDGRPFVASPLYKQRFALADGSCLDDPEYGVAAWPLRIVDGMIELAIGAPPR